MRPLLPDTASLARAVTRSASLQTFATIRLLTDRGRSADAFRAYAYFRWVDDWLDGELADEAQRQVFLARQLDLIKRCYAGEPPAVVSREEAILVELVGNNPERQSPLATYIHNLMAVMSFDADRRGRLITQAELNTYQHALAVAVTEGLHYFIGRNQCAPLTAERYLAVTAAHITHMLRDTCEDLKAGYFNIPMEFLRAHNISALDVDSPAYGLWVQMRVELARRYFRAGWSYLKRVPCARYRMAASAYVARFQTVLGMIEHDGFVLRPEYSACRTLGAGLRMAGSILVASLGLQMPGPAPGAARGDRASGSP